MCAVFEVNLFVEDHLEVARHIIKDFDIQTEEIEVMDNWLFDNLHVLNNTNFEGALKNVEDGKIVVMRGKLGSGANCGIRIYSYGERLFDVVFWISTKLMPELDNGGITKANSATYDCITDKIVKGLWGDRIALCAMGSEISLESCGTLIETVSKSQNVARWISKDSISCDCLPKYAMEKRENYWVYSIYSAR